MFDFGLNARKLFKDEKKKVLVYSQEEFEAIQHGIALLKNCITVMDLEAETKMPVDREYLVQVMKFNVEELERAFK